MQHITVYRDPNRYAGWPANYGMWAWGVELVLCFTLGYPNLTGGFHTRDKTRPFATMEARSLDGGQTWHMREAPFDTPGGRALSADEHVIDELSLARALKEGRPVLPQPCPGGMTFTHPDFALMCARTGLGAGTQAWFYTSRDRCRTWDGPWALPDFGQAGIEARTDYLVDEINTCTLFLTAAKAGSGSGGGEGGHVFCARSVDEGKTFSYLSRITGEVGAGFVIMPSSVRLSPSTIVTAVRCRGERGEFDSAPCWIDLYRSEDNGQTWRYLSRPASDTGRGGNPPAMIQLQDGRLCLCYGYRAPPYGIRARLSYNGGQSWGPEIVLRDDGGNHDLGYPRVIQRPDGAIVTAYYFNERADGERYIGATIWKA